jgi:hypothetical protein
MPLILLLCLVSAGRADDLYADGPESPAGREHAIDPDRSEPAPHIGESPGSFEGERRGGTPPFFESNVVVVIDHSTLSLAASGIDVDQDGVVGRNRSQVTERFGLVTPGQFWTTDSGDTVHALQLEVARALIPRLAARRNKVGLMSFTLRAPRQGAGSSRFKDQPEVLVPVGAPEAVLAALADFPPAHERRRTDLGRLLARAAQLLDVAASEYGAGRPRAVLLLYLGEPSAPDGIHWSSRRALERAVELGERGIAVWGIPIRPGDVGFLDDLTRSTGGRVITIDQLDTRFGEL